MCHFWGTPSWTFFFLKFYLQEPTLASGCQRICIPFDIAFNHAVPWCVLKYKKKWKLMESDVQLFLFVFPENFYMIY